MSEPKTIRVKRYDLCGPDYSRRPHWYRTADSRIAILVPFEEFVGEELDVTVSVAKPKSVREKRAEVLHKFGLEVSMQCPAPGGSVKAALEALEAIDRGER